MDETDRIIINFESGSLIRRQQFSVLRFFLLLIALFGFYSRIDIDLGARVLPNIFAAIGGFSLLLLNINKIKSAHINRIYILLFIVVLSAIFSPQWTVFLGDRLAAVIQFVYSIALAYGIYLEISGYKAQTISKLFLTCFYVIIVGAIVEILTPLKAIVESYSNVYLDPISIADTIRDEAIAGFYRPKFFTSETSHVAFGATISLVYSFFAQPSLSRLAKFFILSLIATAVIRSPIVLLGIPVFAFTYFVQVGINSSSRIRIYNTIKFFAVGILTICLTAIALIVIFPDRISESISGSDFSATIRLFTSIFIGLRAAIEYPLFGAGIGGQASILNIFLETLLKADVPFHVAVDQWDKLINNGIGSHLMYFGFLGLVIYLYSWTRLINALTANNSMPVYCLVLVMCFAIGNIYSPNFIILYFAGSAIISLQRRNLLISTEDQLLTDNRSAFKNSRKYASAPRA